MNCTLNEFLYHFTRILDLVQKCLKWPKIFLFYISITFRKIKTCNFVFFPKESFRLIQHKLGCLGKNEHMSQYNDIGSIINLGAIKIWEQCHLICHQVFSKRRKFLATTLLVKLFAGHFLKLPSSVI